jgi:isopenicillin N synthase-like dioxygenase
MATSVDIVDINPLFSKNTSEWEACDAALWTGLRRTGSVVATGYPDAAMVDIRARRGLEIFTFPEDILAPITSRLVKPGNRNAYRAYWPCLPERLLQTDFYDVGPEDPEPGPNLPGIELFTEQTAWPDGHGDWAADVRAHYDCLNRIAQAMIRSIGRSAGFKGDEIARRFDGSHSTLRFLNYAAGAKTNVQAEDAVLSAGAHTDASGLSLLWQGAPGLQAQGRDGVWRDIPMMENAISVHVGDVMTRLTDGAVPATPHRVLASDTPRQSVGFFLEPALTALVTPARHSGETSERDTYGWQLLETFSRRPLWAGEVNDPGNALVGG